GLAGDKGVVSTSYVKARRRREKAADAGVMLAVVGQTVSEEEEILFAQAVIHPGAARARCLNQWGRSARTVEQVEGVAAERRRAVWRCGEHRPKSSPLRDELLRVRSDQRVDQILLSGRRLQDRRIVQDGRERRLAPDQAFKRREEECFVSSERPAEGEARLIALERRVLRRHGS